MTMRLPKRTKAATAKHRAKYPTRRRLRSLKGAHTRVVRMLT